GKYSPGHCPSQDDRLSRDPISVTTRASPAAAQDRCPGCTGDPAVGPQRSLHWFNGTFHSEKLEIGIVVDVANPNAAINGLDRHVAGQPEHSLRPARLDGVEVNRRGLGTEAE